MLMCVFDLKKNQAFTLYHIEENDEKVLVIEFGRKFEMLNDSYLRSVNKTLTTFISLLAPAEETIRL